MIMIEKKIKHNKYTLSWKKIEYNEDNIYKKYNKCNRYKKNKTIINILDR